MNWYPFRGKLWLHRLYQSRVGRRGWRRWEWCHHLCIHPGTTLRRACRFPRAKNKDVFNPRIPLIPTDVPYQFKRLQFPIRLSFAMTINKGQSLKVAGVHLQTPCFSHGQLYALFIVMANDRRIGNCNLLNWYGTSVGISGILGLKTSLFFARGKRQALLNVVPGWMHRWWHHSHLLHPLLPTLDW